MPEEKLYRVAIVPRELYDSLALSYVNNLMDRVKDQDFETIKREVAQWSRDSKRVIMEWREEK